jgi:GNAT superfamily N-acetyltransferase
MQGTALLRHATVADVALLADHRVSMFRDMGIIKPELEESLRAASIAYFRAAIPGGEYVGWIATPADGSSPAGGAGLQLRSLLPRPNLAGDGVLLGREGQLLNMYVAKPWRSRGIAQQLVEAIIDWCADHGVVRLVLSASAQGRPLYERMGFVATREMSYPGRLASGGPWTGGP